MMERIIFFILAAVSLGFFTVSIYEKLRVIRAGRAEERGDRPLRRWRYFFQQVVLHQKIRKHPLFGVAHIFIMWGFVFLIFSSIHMVSSRLFDRPFPAVFSTPGFVLVRDVFLVLVIGGVIASLTRRLLVKPEWLKNNAEAFIIQALILVIVISEWLYYGKSDEVLLKGISWWVHFLAIFAFFFLIPLSKHLHIVFAPFNTYWHTLAPQGALPPVHCGENGSGRYGVGKPEEFTWKQLFDAFSCAKCGRCNGSCPAYQCGEELKPKRMNGRLRKYMEKRSAVFQVSKQDKEKQSKKGHKKGQNKAKGQGRIAGGIIEEGYLWSCTTCGACMEVCPVSCEHLTKIIDIRRFFVSRDKELPPEVTEVLAGIAEQGIPSGSKRSEDVDYTWAREMGIPTWAEHPGAEYLYFVGCAPAFDLLARRTAVTFAGILQRAGVDFAILGAEEWCCGETARRLGDERLFQQTVGRNITLWREKGIKKIVTACPHCFNTLQNEYAQFGGSYEVIPHTALLAELVARGKIKPSQGPGLVVAYHDPCYLGRYNGFYEEQRELLRALPGIRLIEMPRHKEDSFCCGGGGGRFWVQKDKENVIGQHRWQEALDTGADLIATACPYCRITFERESGRQEAEQKMGIADIAEILSARI
ncbi:CoB--CoM heterodisulfide reductase [Desulfitobacterium hafniense DCB-2]|uniref:CoB--CoM heterodisulfide reductase n=1 Tax=Desulfitobacterium hafniense (strain DSM 10664 / DCB-2) TaxID=272564 RepID=B8FPU0_DESHD|nr:heterodisulfide reductase-related iron-sulfur binding cluster [Desulfitobacterium hafniense]ACL19754.1 CoB--CoM heterodisulfide reductase [Desulfitobacterium hafniense DCB-2]